MESAEHVFPQRVIDRGFPPDWRVYLRQQRRRYLNDRNASLKDRRSKARDIANDAATQRYHRWISRKTLLNQLANDPFDLLKGFELFTVR